MPAHFPVPIQEDIRDLLFELLDRGVAVDKVSKLELEEDEDGGVAEFVTDDGTVGVLCLFDSRFAVRAGAAYAMVPKVDAEDDLRRGDIERHLEAAGEVLHAMARLLNSPSTPPVRMGGVHRLPGGLPGEAAALVAAPEYRRDFAVTIEGYGDGRLSLLVA